MPPDPSAAAPKPTQAIRVLIVDDQSAVRRGLTMLIDSLPIPVQACQNASNKVEAIAALHRFRPHIVLLDIDLDGDDGLTLLPAMARVAQVLVLTSYADAATRARAVQAGASAFVDKRAAAGVLARMVVTLATPHSRGEQAPRNQGCESQPLVGADTDARGTAQPQSQAIVPSHANR